MFQESEITPRIMQAARDAGFEAAGVTPVLGSPVEDSPELKYFSEWISAGYFGDMKYLESRDEKGRLKRASPGNVAPWAKSVVVCAINYNTAPPYSTQVPNELVPGRGWISRYAWGRSDYHDSVMRRLRLVEAAIKVASGEHTLDTLCYVDTGPVVERVVAKYAGVGWIGKNTCAINQQIGSWLFLGVILTSLELRAGLPAPDRCGSCTRCIEACPTNAFVAPYKLDATKCIAYLTIEKRGAIDSELRDGMGRHIFGCDICQDVCPWNRKAPTTDVEEFQPRPELVNPPLEWLARMSEEEFRYTFKGSAVKRAKRNGVRRNAAIAMGNSGDLNFLPTLENLSADQDQSVAEAARWAVRKLRSR